MHTERLRREEGSGALNTTWDPATFGQLPDLRDAKQGGCSDRCVKARALREGEDRYRAVVIHHKKTHEEWGRRQAEMRREKVIRAGGLEIDLYARLVYLDGEILRLTLIEWKILEEMATRPGILLSMDEWTRLVWAGPKDSNALRTNVARLRVKLGPYRKYLRTETSRGYYWKDDDSEDAGPTE